MPTDTYIFCINVLYTHIFCINILFTLDRLLVRDIRNGSGQHRLILAKKIPPIVLKKTAYFLNSFLTP
jgi:hypothetical protein